MAITQAQKNILVIHYSQTGQLTNVAESVVSPLRKAPNFHIHTLELKPHKPYPFPWPFFSFINAFPESVHEKGCVIETPSADVVHQYDLVILAYQVWFLSPSIPVMGFLKSEAAEKILRDTPVITVIACRDMWLQAQETMKSHLQRLGAKLVGNIALVDNAGSALSFFSTPLWMLTGDKGPFKFGIPAAGVSRHEIEIASRFGEAIKSQMTAGAIDESVLAGLGAVRINTNQIASEKIGKRSFKLWGKLFLLFGGPESPARNVLTAIYVIFLLLMIATVVPANYVLKKLFAPLLKKHNEEMRKYYAQPSGENRDKISRTPTKRYDS